MEFSARRPLLQWYTAGASPLSTPSSANVVYYFFHEKWGAFGLRQDEAFEVV